MVIAPRKRKSPHSTEERVLQLLRHSKQPRSAYDLLETLKPEGVRSPPIIYRALKSLEEAGKVHKIHALNAFVACNCSNSHGHEFSVLAICQECGSVKELHDHSVMVQLEGLRGLGVELKPQAVVELPVVCGGCAA